jgi:hypothetical protein
MTGGESEEMKLANDPIWSLICVKNNETCKQQCNLLTQVFSVKYCAKFDAMW